MFHCAPPEVKGLGVMTSTSSRMRSSQSAMPLGLPGRTTKTTTLSWTMPWYSFSSQSAGTRPGSTSRSTSGHSERATRSAGKPASTARLWSPEPLYDCSNSMPAPASVAWKSGMISSYASRGVE